MQHFPRLAILGAGAMGGAILDGVRSPGVRMSGPVMVTTGSAASAAQFAGVDDVIAVAAEHDPDANRKAVRGAGIVVLAVKPWMIHDVLREIADDLEPDAVVVSVAAGITNASMEALTSVAVVRAMPNVASVIGAGVTGVAPGASASDAAVDTVRRLFETVGRVLVLDETRIDALSAVSGSGPAYLYLFIEEFTAAARRLGFSEQEARLLVEGTVSGSAELLARRAAESGTTPEDLRREVASTRGTTEQALNVLQTGGWPDLFDRAFAAAIARAQELARGD